MSRIKYGSASHCALKYAKMKKKPISAQDLMGCFPSRFNKPSRVTEAMQILTKYRFVKPVKDKWQITTVGETYLRGIAQTYRGSDQ